MFFLAAFLRYNFLYFLKRVGGWTDKRYTGGRDWKYGCRLGAAAGERA
ncbi:hypothetical protein KNP414_00591 [Paenibacillus mucilaginosus KNP414]|uniref:Uncharacterized protein n=1 Tax=Paenibacillus mucilaginosus (strain KNP414) TaxID=1036673 RepID=F8FQD4_PAEMK|nr:hypothetical protein KNP414_00591 [Paenibacillus mucilaginosus KNP414]